MALTPLRILHLVNHCCLGHGNVHAAVDLACIQSAMGDLAFYANAEGELHDVLVREGVHCIRLPQRSRDPAVLLRAAIGVVGIIRRHRIDIVHAHMMAGAALGYAATRVTRAKLVTTVHNSFDRHSVIMRFGDRIVAVSSAERDTLAARGFPAARLVTVVNAPLGGARAAYFAEEVALNLPRPNVTTVCGLHARKGVDHLIEAFRLLQERTPCHLNIVGDGPDRARLEALAAATGYGERIRFYGSLPDPIQLLRETDVFVLASLAEPLGLVNIEARSAGCAIVATAVGGVPEALDGGEAGILVPPADPQAIADGVSGLLGDRAALQRMKVRARQGLEPFTIERFYAAYHGIYTALLERHP